MGYFRTSKIRRSTTARRAAATQGRQPCSGPSTGRHAANAALAGTAASAKAHLSEQLAAGSRNAAAQRISASSCAGSSSVMRVSRRCQRLAGPPSACAARAQAGNASRSAAHSAGGGAVSCGLAERIASNAALPEARGRTHMGDMASRASSSAGAVKGLKPSASSCSSPAWAQGSSWSSQASELSAGPSSDQARHRRWVSPAARSACATRRRMHSAATASPRRSYCANSQPSARIPAPATA
mmetsp:Transcript_29393/g.84438  ORF Transcript_29393/g.84438 Transcript_29393/m.84438 type:complete len:241 (+) Transcript_29393:188-910(+)